MPAQRPPEEPSPFTYLLLEDGRRFNGLPLGFEGTVTGEVVFNTSMTGYQEVITDPSYSGQLVTMTYPLIGNYGTNDEDVESARPQVSGFIVREAAVAPSSWRSRVTLHDYLASHGVVGIRDLDTRALTRHIRSEGAMRGGITPGDTPPEQLLGKGARSPEDGGTGFGVRCFTTDEPYVVPAAGREVHIMWRPSTSGSRRVRRDCSLNGAAA